MQVGQKIRYAEQNCTVTKVYKNGKVDLECWVQSGFMQKPELWKYRAVKVRAA